MLCFHLLDEIINRKNNSTDWMISTDRMVKVRECRVKDEKGEL